MRYSQTNLAEDCVASNNDVGYEANNTYESASDLHGDLAINASTGDNLTHRGLCGKRWQQKEPHRG